MDIGGQNTTHHTVNMAKSLPHPERHTGPCLFGPLTHVIHSRSPNLVFWSPVSLQKGLAHRREAGRN